MRSWFKALPLLTLWVVYSEAWFWSWSETGTTLAPRLELEGSGIATGSGEPPSESSTTAGAEIIDEGHVLQTVGQTWDETTEGPRVTTVVPSTQPERGRGAGKTTAGITSRRSKPDAAQPSVGEQQLSQAVVGVEAPAESSTATHSSQCLKLDSSLPFCSSMMGENFTVPNYFNHSSVGEVRALLDEWAPLLRSRCHHAVEWFLCLLLVPECGPAAAPPALPCRRFCEVLRDSCWALLDEGRLPVECQALPDEEDDGFQCLSVCIQKGNCWCK